MGLVNDGAIIFSLQRTSDKTVIRVAQGRIVGHLWSAAIWILSVRQELIHSIKGVRLDGIIGSEYDELGDVALEIQQQRLSIFTACGL